MDAVKHFPCSDLPMAREPAAVRLVSTAFLQSISRSAYTFPPSRLGRPLSPSRGLVRAKVPITLRDVARDAGVSAATVSRALSTPDRVHADTLARVLAAAHARGYVLDGAARALREGRTRTVGA